MAKLQLGFHGTFALKKADILKIMDAAAEERGLNDSKKILMERTGLGNEKVLRIKTWAVRSGLVSNNKLSPEGERVRQFDPDLESPVTDWLMHFYLSFGGYGLQPPPERPADWGGWPHFVFEFLPENPDFTLDELVAKIAPVFETENLRIVRNNLNYLLRAYTENYALFNCRFLEKDDDRRFVSGSPTLPNDYTISYFIARLWRRDFPGAEAVPLAKILEQKMGVIPILGIGRSQFLIVLDRLEKLGIIQLNREYPESVVRHWADPLDLLEKAYQY